MQLVERLLAIAVGPKKVSIAHILDKATAGATIALALVYMKTGDESVANKIDIPETAHLLDYVRPDIFLLRTVAKHLIMWDKVGGSFQWIQDNLRDFHRDGYMMTPIKALYSEDLPFYNIMAGLCFSIGLKFAGSGNETIRDLLIHYLDEFTRLASLQGVFLSLRYNILLKFSDGMGSKKICSNEPRSGTHQDHRAELSRSGSSVCC